MASPHRAPVRRVRGFGGRGAGNLAVGRVEMRDVVHAVDHGMAPAARELEDLTSDVRMRRRRQGRGRAVLDASVRPRRGSGRRRAVGRTFDDRAGGRDRPRGERGRGFFLLAQMVDGIEVDIPERRQGPRSRSAPDPRWTVTQAERPQQGYKLPAAISCVGPLRVHEPRGSQRLRQPRLSLSLGQCRLRPRRSSSCRRWSPALLPSRSTSPGGLVTNSGPPRDLRRPRAPDRSAEATGVSAKATPGGPVDLLPESRSRPLGRGSRDSLRLHG